jgi:Ferric reductase like transmembrane component
MTIAAISGPSALWYLTRGTGIVALILLTLSVALGVANVRRAQTASVPRFVFGSIHRSASLLAVVFVLLHIATSLLDGYAPIRLIDVIVPFRSAYRPLWLGFGALAFDLLIAVTLTSVLRRRLGYRAWRATHWAAYACWPVGLLHGLGTGSDTKTSWMLGITAVCVIAVIIAVVARATEGWGAGGWPSHAGARTTAIVASALIPLGLLVWLPSGPLAAGWAQRAGTPSSLLRTTATAASTGSAAAGSGGTRTSFTALMSGTSHQGQLDQGLADIHLSLSISGQQLNRLSIRIIGPPVDGGGVEMASGRVQLGTSSDPSLYSGQVTSLSGTDIIAVVSGSAGARLRLSARLQVDPVSGTASGVLSCQPTGGT